MEFGAQRKERVMVRVRGRYACRMYLRGWVIWWPGARLIQEGWLVDVYQVSGDMQTFLAAMKATGCRAMEKEGCL